MGIIIRQGFKATIVNYIGVVLGAFNTMYLFPLILTSSEIGLVRLLSDIALLFSSVAQFGLSVNMVKFFPSFKDDNKDHNGFFFITFLLPIIGFLITSLVVYFYKDQILTYYATNSPMIIDFFQYIFPMALGMMFMVYFETTASLVNRIAIPKFIREVLIRILVIGSLLAYYGKLIDFRTFVLFQVVIYLIAAVVNFIYARKLIHISLKPDFSLFTPAFTKELSTYSIYTIIGSLSTIVVAKIDTIMIGSMEGLSSTGIYSISFFIALFIETPHRALISIAMPILSEALNDNNFDKVKEISRSTSANQFLIASFFYVNIVANINNLFAMMPHGNEYIAGKYVIILVGAAKLIEMISGLNSPIVGFKYFRFALFISIFVSVLMVITNLIFIPIFSITGAAIATLLTTFIIHTLLHVFLYWRFDFTPITRKIILNLILMLLLLFASSFIDRMFNKWADLFIRCSILSTLFLWISYKLALSPELNKLADSYILKPLGIKNPSEN